MALTLHLVRHGRTVYNTERRIQGWCDSPLTPEGRAGVRATADHLRGHRFDAAYSSTSGRTVATAREILAHHPATALTSHDDLREFHFGELEATPEADLNARIDPFELFQGVFAGTFEGFPGGEAAGRYLERVAAGFDRIERAHGDGESVLVVSHGVTLMAYLRMVGDPEPRPLPNASISTVEVFRDGTRRITSFAVDPSGQGMPAPARLAPAPPARPDLHPSRGQRAASTSASA